MVVVNKYPSTIGAAYVALVVQVRPAPSRSPCRVPTMCSTQGYMLRNWSGWGLVQLSLFGHADRENVTFACRPNFATDRLAFALGTRCRERDAVHEAAWRRRFDRPSWHPTRRCGFWHCVLHVPGVSVLNLRTLQSWLGTPPAAQRVAVLCVP